MSDEADGFTIQIPIEFSAVEGAQSMADVIAITEELVDNAQSIIFRLLCRAYGVQDKLDYGEELITSMSCPWSRADSVGSMMEDFVDYGWAITLLDLIEPEENRDAMWAIKLTQSSDGLIVRGKEKLPADIEEYAYSREGALGAAWVRMRDIEAMRAN